MKHALRMILERGLLAMTLLVIFAAGREGVASLKITGSPENLEPMADEPEQIEANMHRSAVAIAAAKYHINRWEFDDAAQVLEPLLDVPNDSDTYRRLIELHLRRGDFEGVARVGHELIAHSKDEGFQPSIDAQKLARELCKLHRFDEATDLAQFAAGTMMAEGLWTCGNLHGHLGKWDEFNQLLAACDSYPLMYWYFNCRTFGQGDLQGARRAAQRNLPGLLSSDDPQRCYTAVYLTLEGQTDKAAKSMFGFLNATRRRSPGPDPRSNLVGAVLADPKKHTAERDACLANVTRSWASTKNQGSCPQLLAAEFQAHLNKGTRGELDETYIDGILAQEPYTNTMSSLTALFCEKYTTDAQAIRYAKRALRRSDFATAYDALACDLLQRHDIDPLELLAEPVWPGRPAGSVDEITIEVPVMGTLELAILEEGLQLLLHDGPPSSVPKATVNGQEWKMRWTKTPPLYSEYPPSRSSILPLDIGLAAFDVVECSARDQRNGEPSERPGRVILVPKQDQLGVVILDQARGPGWYTIKLKRRQDHQFPWPTGHVVLVDRLRDDLYALNPRAIARSPAHEGQMSLRFSMLRVGKPATLRVWLSRRTDAPAKGTLKFSRAGDVPLLDLDDVGPLPVASSFGQAKMFEFDISQYISNPSEHLHLSFRLRGKSQKHGIVDLWRIECETELEEAEPEEE